MQSIRGALQLSALLYEGFTFWFYFAGIYINQCKQIHSWWANPGACQSAIANEMPCCVTSNTWSLLLSLWTSVDVALQVYRMKDAGQAKGLSCCAFVAY